MKASDSGLTARQIQKVRRVLEPFQGDIQRVAVFGSRATGLWRVGSDLDLVVFGPISARQIDRIWTAFDESDLSITVDIVAYDHIKNARLLDHIDHEALPLPPGPALDDRHSVAAE